jgi:hypothetical protein
VVTDNKGTARPTDTINVAFKKNADAESVGLRWFYCARSKEKGRQLVMKNWRDPSRPDYQDPKTFPGAIKMLVEFDRTSPLLNADKMLETRKMQAKFDEYALDSIVIPSLANAQGAKSQSRYLTIIIARDPQRKAYRRIADTWSKSKIGIRTGRAVTAGGPKDQTAWRTCDCAKPEPCFQARECLVH